MAPLQGTNANLLVLALGAKRSGKSTLLLGGEPHAEGVTHIAVRGLLAELRRRLGIATAAAAISSGHAARSRTPSPMSSPRSARSAPVSSAPCSPQQGRRQGEPVLWLTIVEASHERSVTLLRIAGWTDFSMQGEEALVEEMAGALARRDGAHAAARHVVVSATVEMGAARYVYQFADVAWHADEARARGQAQAVSLEPLRAALRGLAARGAGPSPDG